MKIAIVNTKGGVGKTTTAVYLALAAHQRGQRVLALDADPQASLTDWAERAKATGDGLPFDVEPANVRSLQRPRSDVDMTVIDTPPGNPALIDAAVNAADVVIIPCQASPLDVTRAWETLAVAQHKPCAVILTSADPNTLLFKEARAAFLDNEVSVFEFPIRRREAIRQSFGTTPTKLHNHDFILDELQEALS